MNISLKTEHILAKKLPSKPLPISLIRSEHVL